MNPEEALLEGRKILDGVLVPAGFHFALAEVGTSSGGSFASGLYMRGHRRLELHFRESLGPVRYHIRHVSVLHETLMRALGAQGAHEYPGSSDDPLDAFRHLRRDLERHGAGFLGGPDEQLRDLLEEAQRQEADRPTGFNQIP